MKVLHLSSEKSWRGGEQQIAYLIEELETMGAECHVACRSGSMFEVYSKEKGLAYLSLPFMNELDIKTASGIKRYCKANDIDLIHIHSGKSHGIAVMAGLLGNSTKMVLSRRVDFPLSGNFLASMKYNFNKIDKIICVSDKIREVIGPALKDPGKCVTVHSGIDLSRFETNEPKGLLRSIYNIPADTKLIGNTSALAPHKDYFTFINAAEILIKEGIDARFFIIGEGTVRDQVSDYIREKGLEEFVIMTGFLDNIPEIMPELDVFMISSKTEGLGTSILDAFACRVPVAATSAGGIPEIVLHNKTGLLCEPGDHNTLAANVRLLLDNKNLRDDLIDGATAHLRNFTKENTALKTLEIYKEILSA